MRKIHIFLDDDRYYTPMAVALYRVIEYAVEVIVRYFDIYANSDRRKE